MDNRVEPCIDFYKFACGGFIEKEIIEQRRSTIAILRNGIIANLISMLESENEPDESKSFQLAKKLYRSCMSMTEDREIEHVKEILKELGGWPVLDGESWDDTRFNWRRWMYKARKVGDSGDCFFGFQSSLNMDGTKTVLELTEPQIDPAIWQTALTPDSSSQSTKNYSALFVYVAQTFGVDKDRATTGFEESFLFGKELLKILGRPERQNQGRVPFDGTLLELKKAHPSVAWSEYFNSFLPPNMSLADDEIVTVEKPYYFAKLETLMSNTTKRVQANYAFWRVLMSKMKYFNGNIRDLYNYVVSQGKIKLMPFWETCFVDVTTSFAYSVNARYVKKYVSKEIRKNATEMFEGIKQQLMITVQQTEWLDEETRKSALKKAAAMKGDIGYDDQLLDDNLIEEQYRGMQFTEDSYLENKFNQESVTLAAESKALRGTAKPIVLSLIDKLMTEVNAQLFPPTLTIVVSAGILQHPVYSIDQPTYMNYGAAGSVMGHELIHAFDDTYIEYDKNYQETPWLGTSSRNKFMERVQCLIDQYANYTGYKPKEFGEDYFGEHIADNGGIKLAYRAYKNWVAKNGEEPRLPGLEDYSPRQMFWISYANYFCSKNTEEYLKFRIAKSSYAPDEYRVIGTLSNIPEFAEDFECSKKSDSAKDSTPFAMIPEKRCSVW